MRVIEAIKGIVNKNTRRRYSETEKPTVDTAYPKMITSCSCPHLSLKASTAEQVASSHNKALPSDSLNCDDDIDIENEFVFVPPLTKPEVEFENPSAACSIEGSIKSCDSLLSSPSSFDSSENKSSTPDSEYQSCFSDRFNNKNSCKFSDSNLLTTLQCESNGDKSSKSDYEYHSCLGVEVNKKPQSCQRQTSCASSTGSDVIEIDYVEPVHIPYSEIPAMGLSVRTRTQMSLLLNMPLTLGNDWKMLAGELGFEYVETENFALQKDPAGSMINQWSTKGDSTFEKLIDALTFIDRLDVLNNIKKFIERDADSWRKKLEREANPFQPMAISEFAASNYPNLPETPENRGITLHDHPSGPIETFDAFVCFTIDDRAFVLEMMSHLERPPYNMKLCVGFRDLVPGAAWMTSAAELIGKRCKRMIVVLSPRFTKSPECDFQAKFALSLTPGNRLKRIVPIMYEMCSVPEILRFISVCDYTKVDLRPFFWERLSVALGLN